MSHDPCPMTRLGIIGGTFDPIHIGHLIIAQESHCRLKLDRVIFVPAGQPPHKPDEPVSDIEHRHRMTVLATRHNPAFETSRMEIERLGPSYTVDTLRQLKQVYGEETELFLIVGADSLLEILTWHQPENIAALCRIVAATRPCYDIRDAEKALPAKILERVIFLRGPEVAVSATDIRRRVAEGIPITYLVPQTVEEYIIESGLYRSNN